MNSTDFENSQIFEKLEQLNTVLDNDLSKEKIDVDNYNFLKSGIDFISDRLKVTIPSIVNDSDLNTVISELTNTTTQVNNFLGNNNIGHLNNAKNHLFACITRARNFPIPLSKSDFNFSKSIANFENIVNEKFNNLSKEKDSLSKQIDSLNKSVQLKTQELDRLSKLLAQKETAIQNLNSSFQTDYTNIKNSANQNYEQDRKTYRAEIDKEKNIYRNEVDNLKKLIDTDTSKLVKSLEEKLDEAKKIVNVIGNVGATGNFQNIANTHKKSANTWRIIAILFMTILSGLLVFTIWDMSAGTFEWSKSLIRIIAAAALSYPATYAAQESSKHRKQEDYNRRIELELASVNPFIELLDENKKKEIKEKLVGKYFGNNNGSASSDKKGDIDIPVSAFEKIINTVGNVLNKQ